MVAPVHKNTNAPLILLILIACDVIFSMLRSGQFGGQKNLGPLEKPLPHD
jgi:hypothetical protein